MKIRIPSHGPVTVWDDYIEIPGDGPIEIYVDETPVVPGVGDAMLFEDGNRMLFENGNVMIFE